MIRRGLSYVYAIGAALFMVVAGVVLFLAIVVPLFVFLASPFIPR